MKLEDIAPLEKWIDLEVDIHQQTGLDVNVFNVKGYRITEFKNWVNNLCPEIKATDKGQSFICAPAHMNIAAAAMRSKKPAIEECDAGLVKMVVPIFVRDEFVGAVGACGFLLDDGEVDSFLVYKMTDIDEAKVEKLSNGIPAITSAKAESLSQYITTRINEILGQMKSPHT
jgi:ligand-binding sensor protein